MYAPLRADIYLLISLLILSPVLSTTFTSRWNPWQHRAPIRRDTGTKNDSQPANRMRILALFSSTSNDMGIDHRIGRQVLKLALERAKRLRPEVGEIQLIIHNEEADCSESSAMPNYVAEQFYSDSHTATQCDPEAQSGDTDTTAEAKPFKHVGQTTTLQPIGDRDQDRCRLGRGGTGRINNELDEYFGEEQTSSDSEDLAKTSNQRDSASASRIDAIIGPSCDSLVDIVARMAAYWRTPIYTVTSINAHFGRKDVYSTLTRLSPSIEHLSMFIVRIMKHFKWKHMAILVDRKRLENQFLLENLERTIDHNQHQIPIERKVLVLDRDGLLATNRTTSADVTTGQNITSKTSLCNEETRTKLVGASLVARVFLLLLDDIRSIRTVLLCAHELEMNNGEYTFIAPNLALESTGGREVSTVTADASDRPQTSKSGRGVSSLDWFVAEDEANNVKARQMFESLMVLSVEQPVGDEYNAFVEQTLDLANQAYPSLRFDRSSLGPMAVALHDSLLLAVEAHWRRKSSSVGDKMHNALRGDLSGNGSVDSEGYSMLDTGEADLYKAEALMWNTTYTSGLMTSLHINSNGDQELDYIMSDLEPEMGSMRPVASYSKQTRRVQMLANSYIHWPARVVSGSNRQVIDSDEAPPDEPECGFDGMAERCIDRQNLYAVLTVMLILVLLIIAASGISLRRYKRIKYQMKLDDYWWRIQWEELSFLDLSGGFSMVGSGISGGGGSVPPGAKSRVGQSDMSGEHPTAPTLVGRSIAGSRLAASSGLRSGHDDKVSVIKSEFSVVVRQSRLAKYKDDHVIVKQLNANSIDISRDLLIELKSMRELCQENLARFVGLCIDPGRLSIVGEYCSRGSLKDLLGNEGVAMDRTLKYSILGDIINGLNFIHTSLLNFHGRLKSTNLVLDSRFTVKLTDFGLRSLYNQLDAVEDQSDDDFGNNNDNESGRTMVDARTLSQRRPSMTQTIYQMDSVSMRGEQTAPGQMRGGIGSVSGSADMQVRQKNRGPMRYFWTAPEHLRDKCPHFAGSKRGDIYSLAIIMFELFTRKEPYHYGTNASPNWTAIRKCKQADQRLSSAHTKLSDRLRSARLSIVSAASSQLSIRRKSRLSTAGAGAGLSGMIGRQADRARDRIRRSQASVGPTHEEEVAAEKRPVAGSTIVRQASLAQPVEQPSISVSSVENTPTGERQHIEGDASDDPCRKGSGTTSAVSAGSRQVSTASKLSHKKAATSSMGNKGSVAGSVTVTAAMANEILDQLRMGVQPEPVRPYVPNFILQDVDANLVELMRTCWQEAPAMRPTVERVRSKIKKITAGVASKNYLDNLLERLQTYASQLERIVDEKSADIIAEKARTEELLYQLVPRFVADKLKHHEPIIPQLFDGVTVFFSDIVGFEKYAAVMSPIELVDLLNNIYSSFESIINSFDVIKIEVILDQFLVAAGILLQDGGVSGAAVEEQQPLPAESATAGMANKEQGHIQQDEDGTKAGRGAVKSTRKLLTAIKLSHSQGGTGAAEGGNDKSNEQQQQVKCNNGQQQTTNKGQISMATSSENYKQNCAEQIARMALCIRDLVKSFHFRHTLSASTSAQASEVGGSCKEGVGDSNQKAPACDSETGELALVKDSKPKLVNIVAATFNIRIGIHSGKVCAGIVGLKRPKFCLIGDTVNVASRMHTNSKANKIQVSADTANLLRGVPGLFMQARGKIEVKGKGQMETYWLETSH